MRFAKVFVLLCLFVLCILFVRETAQHVRKQLPETVITTKAEQIAFYEKLQAGLQGDDAARAEATRLNEEFLAKLRPRVQILFLGELTAYLLCALAGTLIYLSFNRRQG